jgi:TatD DNase family protein
MIFDTHCHYNLEPLSQNWQKQWKIAQENDVQKAVVVGTSTQTSQLAVEIAKQEEHLWASVAIHPIEYIELITEQHIATTDIQSFLAPLPREFCQTLEGILSISEKIVAIGETGLDYFHIHHQESFTEENKATVIATQQDSLKQHIQLAQKYTLPLILHVRDQAEQAYWDTLALLDEMNYTGKFVLHCVSGPTAYVQKALEMGAYVSAAGNITYKNAEHLRDLVRLVPKDKILIETDAPYLPPQDFRGQICEPWMISQTAEFLERELAISPETTWQNAHTFFELA